MKCRYFIPLALLFFAGVQGYSHSQALYPSYTENQVESAPAEKFEWRNLSSKEGASSQSVEAADSISVNHSAKHPRKHRVEVKQEKKAALVERTKKSVHEKKVAAPRTHVRAVEPDMDQAPVLNASAPKHLALAKKTAKKPLHVDRIAALRQAEKKPIKTAKENDGISVMTVVSTLLWLALVLGLAYLTILALKAISNKRVISPQCGVPGLQVKDVARLSPNNTLHMVNVNGKSLLIASTSEQVSILAEFDAEKDEDTVEIPNNHFAEYLAKYSESTPHSTPASRLAGLLRDCTDHLQKRRVTALGGGTGNEK